MSDDLDNLVDFTKIHATRTAEQSRERESALIERAHDEFDGDVPLAMVEVFWCMSTFKTSFLLRDRTNTQEIDFIPPRTPEQRAFLLRELRWIANWQARMWDLEDLVREEDWAGRPPTEEEPEDEPEDEPEGQALPWERDPNG